MVRQLAALVIAAFAMTGCDFTPKGATVFKIGGKREYDKAQLKYPETEGETRLPLKLRWADTNTWLTTETLAPGNYLLTARTNEGAYYAGNVAVKAGQNRYELAPEQRQQVSLDSGPAVSGIVKASSNSQTPTQVAVVFIGHDVTVKRVATEKGKFTANAPVPGRYRIEVHALGSQPKSYAAAVQDVTGDLDLGTIELK